MEDAMSAVNVVTAFDHGHIFQGDIAQADGAGELTRFGGFGGGGRGLGLCFFTLVVLRF